MGVMRRHPGVVLGDLLGLWVYGATLRTQKVVREVGFLGLALGLQFFIDLWVWCRTWHLALGSWSQAIPLGFAFAALVLAYDRSVVVMDTKNGAGLWRGLILRAGILLALSAVTAVPTELAVFAPEIDRRIESREKVAVDQIRHDAVEREARVWNERIARAIQESGGDTARSHGTRDRQREQLVAGQRAQRETLTRAVQTARESATREAAGAGPSGRRGAGNVYTALTAQIAVAQNALDAFEIQAANVLREFDRETERLTGTAATNGRSAVRGLEHERDAALARVRLLPPATLAALYGGEWQEPRGFLARYRTLEALRKEDGTTNAITWACRIVMMAIGFLVLGLKLTQSKDAKEYFSLASQAAAGNPEAVEVVQNMGFQDLKAHGSDPEVVRMTEAFYAKARDVAQALLTFEGVAHMTSQKKVEGTNRHLGFDAVISALRDEFRSFVQPKIHELAATAERLRLRGAPVPSWPAELNNSQDPRDPKFQPWNRMREDLAREYGWIDPQPELERLTHARSRLLEARQQLSKVLAATDAHAARLAADKKAPEDIRRLRLAQWSAVHEPLLGEIDALERALEDGSMPVPEWPRHFPDPRIPLMQRMLRLQAEQARGEELEELGRAKTVFPEPSLIEERPSKLNGVNGHAETSPQPPKPGDKIN